MSETTIFEKMMHGEIPCQKIYEDDICVAIVDKFPTTPGQCLIFTKKNFEYIFDVDDKTYEHIFKIAKKLALALDLTFSPIRTCLVVEGFEVPHVHIKLFPVQTNSLKTGAGTMISDAEMLEIAEKIKANL